MKRQRILEERQLSVKEAAVRGAIAGLAGGAAMIAAEALAENGWVRNRGSVLRALGAPAHRERVQFRSPRTARAIAIQLASSAALGAAYGVLRSRSRKMPGAFESLLDGGLSFIASLAAERGASEFKLRARRRHGLAGRFPIGTQDIFTRATSSTFSTLAR